MQTSPPPDIDPMQPALVGICEDCATPDKGTRSLSQGIHQLVALNWKRDALTNNLVLTTPATVIAFNEGESDTSTGVTGYATIPHNVYTTNAFARGFLSINDPFDVEAVGFAVEGVMCPEGGVSAAGVITSLNGTEPSWLGAYKASLIQQTLQSFGMTLTFNTGELCEYQMGSLQQFPGGAGLPFSQQENGVSATPNVVYLKRKMRTPPLVTTGTANWQVKMYKLFGRTVARIPTVAPAPDADVSVLVRVTNYGKRAYGKVWKKE